MPHKLQIRQRRDLAHRGGKRRFAVAQIRSQTKQASWHEKVSRKSKRRKEFDGRILTANQR
jgi:hypothetical protein